MHRRSKSSKKSKKSRSRRGGMRLGRTIAKAVVPLGLFMTQKSMRKRRRSRKNRSSRRK